MSEVPQEQETDSTQKKKKKKKTLTKAKKSEKNGKHQFREELIMLSDGNILAIGFETHQRDDAIPGRERHQVQQWYRQRRWAKQPSYPLHCSCVKKIKVTWDKQRKSSSLLRSDARLARFFVASPPSRERPSSPPATDPMSVDDSEGGIRELLFPPTANGSRKTPTKAKPNERGSLLGGNKASERKPIRVEQGYASYGSLDKLLEGRKKPNQVGSNVLASPSADGTAIVHTVSMRDTLASLSLKYGVKVRGKIAASGFF
jgi:hypothetical protein